MDDPVDPRHRRRASPAFPGLRPGVRARWSRPVRVRCVRTERTDPARLHRVVSRPAAPGGRRAGPEPGPQAVRVTDDASALYRPAGSLADGAWSVVLTPEAAGWRFCGLRAAMLAPGARSLSRRAGDEVVVLPLEGAFEVTVDGARYRARRVAPTCGRVPPTSCMRRRAQRSRSPAPVVVGSPSPPPEANGASRSATSRRPTSRSSCAGRAPARARSATSRRRIASRLTG